MVEAGSGRAALETLAEDDELDLVICDISLPDVRGPELVRRLRERRPGLKVLVISGYLDDALTARGILGPELPFLAKPFSSEELRGKVRSLLAAPRPAEPDRREDTAGSR